MKWVWSDENLDTHNVVLTERPPEGRQEERLPLLLGRRRAHVQAQVHGPGKYGFICTYHSGVMRIELKVKKR